MKTETTNCRTVIMGRCVDLQEFCTYLQANCGVSIDAIEQRFTALAMEFAQKHNVLMMPIKDGVCFHAKGYKPITNFDN